MQFNLLAAVMRARAVGLALVAAAAVAPQSSFAICQSTSVRMSQMLKTVPTRKVSVLAHRGLWGHYAGDVGIPENSRASLQAANDQCMDAVELDVKMTSDGVAVLLHDFNLGRTTDVYTTVRGGRKYNPMDNTGINPAVQSMSWQDVQWLRLLSSDRNFVTGFHVPDVYGVFSYHNQRRLSVPMVFDTKTADAVREVNRLAQIFFSQPHQVVAVKVNATLYPTARAFFADAPRIIGIPVFTTNMLQFIHVPNARANWQSAVPALEVNVKTRNGLLKGELNAVRGAGKAAGVFNAIPDGPGPALFYKNTGQCCYRLPDLFYSGPGGRDIDDWRGDWGYIVDQDFTFITTDNPRGLISYLERRGLR